MPSIRPSIICWQILLLAAIGLGPAAGAAVARDKVVVRAGDGGRVTLNGSILDFTGESVTIRVDESRKPQTVPTSELLAVEADLGNTFDAGRRHVDKFDFRSAQTAFELFLETEERPWARREGLASLVRISLATDSLEESKVRFLPLFKSDATTPHFHLAPLLWEPRQATEALRRAAATWQTEDSPIVQLAAASCLLGATPLTNETRLALASAARSEIQPLRRLGQAQLWRVRLLAPTLAAEEVERWEQTVETWPEHLRSGPYLVVGQGYTVFRQHSQAASAFLWAASRTDENPSIRAWGLLLAASSLREAGQPDQADQLLDELRITAPHSAAAKLVENHRR